MIGNLEIGARPDPQPTYPNLTDELGKVALTPSSTNAFPMQFDSPGCSSPQILGIHISASFYDYKNFGNNRHHIL